MDDTRRFKIAVLGSATESENSLTGRRAARIGVAIARHGGVLLTGGCPGYPHAAVRGAQSAAGLTVAISPAMNRHEHGTIHLYPTAGDIIVFTGMGKKGRNVILVRSADACIFVGGGMGTLNEFTIAFDELGSESVIAVLSGSGGFSDEYVRLTERARRSSVPQLMVESNPELLVEKVFYFLTKDDPGHG